MKEIVEDGRRRAEVAWAMGAVRFDADFIEGYDRQGQELWRARWAEIESAVPGPDSLRLFERGGRVLEAPPTPEMAAACHWLLPEQAQIMVRRPAFTAVRYTLGCVLLLLAGWLGLIWFGGAFVAGSDHPEVKAVFGGAMASGAAGLALCLFPITTMTPSTVKESPPNAEACLRLSMILGDQCFLFQRAQWSRKIFLRIAAFLLGIWPSLGLLPVGAWSFGLMSLVMNIVWLAVIISFAAMSLTGLPPKSAWLQVQGKTVRFLPPGQTQLVEVEMKDGRIGSAGRDWTIWLDDFVLCRDAPEQIGTNQA